MDHSMYKGFDLYTNNLIHWLTVHWTPKCGASGKLERRKWPQPCPVDKCWQLIIKNKFLSPQGGVSADACKIINTAYFYYFVKKERGNQVVCSCVVELIYSHPAHVDVLLQQRVVWSRLTSCKANSFVICNVNSVRVVTIRVFAKTLPPLMS